MVWTLQSCDAAAMQVFYHDITPKVSVRVFVVRRLIGQSDEGN